MTKHAKPAKAEAALAALKQLDRWAVKRDYLPRPITYGVEVEPSDGGHVPWTDEQVAIAERGAAEYHGEAVTQLEHALQAALL